MKFYYCEGCGTRVSEYDLEDGSAKDKKQRGIFCSLCASNVLTQEFVPITDEQLQEVKGAHIQSEGKGKDEGVGNAVSPQEYLDAKSRKLNVWEVEAAVARALEKDKNAIRVSIPLLIVLGLVLVLIGALFAKYAITPRVTDVEKIHATPAREEKTTDANLTELPPESDPDDKALKRGSSFIVQGPGGLSPDPDLDSSGNVKLPAGSILEDNTVIVTRAVKDTQVAKTPPKTISKPRPKRKKVTVRKVRRHVVPRRTASSSRSSRSNDQAQILFGNYFKEILGHIRKGDLAQADARAKRATVDSALNVLKDATGLLHSGTSQLVAVRDAGRLELKNHIGKFMDFRLSLGDQEIFLHGRLVASDDDLVSVDTGWVTSDGVKKPGQTIRIANDYLTHGFWLSIVTSPAKNDNARLLAQILDDLTFASEADVFSSFLAPRLENDALETTIRSCVIANRTTRKTPFQFSLPEQMREKRIVAWVKAEQIAREKVAKLTWERFDERVRSTNDSNRELWKALDEFIIQFARTKFLASSVVVREKARLRLGAKLKVTGYKGSWKRLRPSYFSVKSKSINKSPQQFTSFVGACFDSKRNRCILFSSVQPAGLWSFDVMTNSWVKLAGEFLKDGETIRTYSRPMPLCYDPDQDCYWMVDRRRLVKFDPKTKVWQLVHPQIGSAIGLSSRYSIIPALGYHRRTGALVAPTRLFRVYRGQANVLRKVQSTNNGLIRSRFSNSTAVMPGSFSCDERGLFLMLDGYENMYSGGGERGERARSTQAAKNGGGTWVLDPSRGTLSKLRTKQSPSNRVEASMVYLKALRCWLLLGGRGGTHYDLRQKTDAWVFSSATMTWTPLQGSMPFAQKMAVWYDPVHERVLMVSENTGAMWELKISPEWAKR